MWVIRDEQLTALAEPVRAAFVRRTLANLIDLLPGDPRLADERAALATIDDGIARAARHGIARAREVQLFVFLLFDLGPDFERAPGREWMADLLADPELDGQAKMDVIYRRLTLEAPAAAGDAP